MNRSLFAAALLAGLTTLVHFFAGGKDVATPLLQSSLDETLKQTLYVCWHGITLVLAGSALVLGIAAQKGRSASMRSLVLFVSALWSAFGVLFLVVAATQAAPFWSLPQWTILFPVGVLAWWGCRSLQPSVTAARS